MQQYYITDLTHYDVALAPSPLLVVQYKVHLHIVVKCLEDGLVLLDLIAVPGLAGCWSHAMQGTGHEGDRMCQAPDGQALDIIHFPFLCVTIVQILEDYLGAFHLIERKRGMVSFVTRTWVNRKYYSLTIT